MSIAERYTAAIHVDDVSLEADGIVHLKMKSHSLNRALQRIAL